MARALPPGTAPVVRERTITLTRAEALEHSDPAVRALGHAWPAIEQAYRAMDALERHRRWRRDPLRIFDRLVRAKDDPAARWRLAMRVVRRWPKLVVAWPRKPAVRRRLAEEADARGGSAAVRRWLRTSIYPQAVLDVAEAFHTPKTIRLGVDYLKDTKGRVVAFRLPDLTVPIVRRRLRQLIRARAEHLVAGEPQRLVLLGERVERLKQPDAAESLAVAARRLPRSIRGLLQYLTRRGLRLTPRERELLAYLVRKGGNAASVAARLDMSPTAVRVAAHRFMKKLMKKLRAP